MVGTRKVHIPNPTLAKRLAKKRKLVASGCMEWTAYTDPKTGYGSISNAPGNPISGHVAAWITIFGPVPTGLVVRHKCDNTLCVEVRHLELGTDADNIADMIKRGRKATVPKKDHCLRGHEFDFLNSNGHQACSICVGINARRRDTAKRRNRGVPRTTVSCSRCFYAVERCHCVEFNLIPTLEMDKK